MQQVGYTRYEKEPLALPSFLIIFPQLFLIEEVISPGKRFPWEINSSRIFMFVLNNSLVVASIKHPFDYLPEQTICGLLSSFWPLFNLFETIFALNSLTQHLHCLADNQNPFPMLIFGFFNSIPIFFAWNLISHIYTVSCFMFYPGEFVIRSRSGWPEDDQSF